MNVIIVTIFLLINLLPSFGDLIEEGVYNIITLDNLFLNYKGKITISNCYYKSYSPSLFKIFKQSNNFYYNIEQVIKEGKLGYSDKNLNIILCREKNSNIEWNFIKRGNHKYIIKNKEDCYIKISNLKITCEKIPIEQATQFKLNKIYEEVEGNPIENDLIEKEPIDVLLKYIDLRDPNLKRNDIHQIKKDYDNEELKYSIRSILENIPWVNKIFILMPNEKVRYFKDYNLIRNKIVYVKDHDILGHESSNFNAFIFNFWKLKDFGISDNFIYMDDDYFIGQKLKKSDFFYVQKNKIIPAIISSSFLNINKSMVEKNHKKLRKKAYLSKKEQNGIAFSYSKFKTYFFILNIFKKDKLILPKFNHNAIPLNVYEIKEIFEIVKKSKYKKATLDSLYRQIGYIQFQSFYLSYFFIKYKRKVNLIPSKYIDVGKIKFDVIQKSPLFCINTGAGNYSYLIFHKAKIFMEYLFPKQTPYEIADNSLFEPIKKEEKLYKKAIKQLNKKVYILYSELLLVTIIIILFFMKFIIKEYQV